MAKHMQRGMCSWNLVSDRLDNSKVPSGSYILWLWVSWRSKFQGCPARWWWWQTLESEGHSPGSGHLWWMSSTQLLPAPLGPGCSSIPASFLSVLWPEPQLHLSSASSSLKLFLFSCKWAVYDDHYLNGLRWAPGCLSAADGLLIRWVSTPTGPGPKSGALLIMAP